MTEIARAVADRVECVMDKVKVEREMALQYIHRVPRRFFEAYWSKELVRLMVQRVNIMAKRLNGGESLPTRERHGNYHGTEVLRTAIDQYVVFNKRFGRIDHYSAFYATLRRIDDIKLLGRYKRFMHFHIECGIDSVTPSER